MKQANPAHDGFLIAIAGGQGCGKTLLVRHLVPRLSTKFPRVVVCDPRGQFAPDSPGGPVPFPAFVKFMDSGRPGIVYVSASSDSDRRYIGEVVWHYGNAVVVADEFQLYGNAAEFQYPAWKLIATEGRNYGIGMVVSTQRLTFCPKVILTNLTDLVMFRTTHVADVSYARTVYGQLANTLPTLPKFRALHWGRNRELLPVRVLQASKWRKKR